MQATFGHDCPKHHHNVLILGGGFAGLYAAHELQRHTRREDPSISVGLINRDNIFVYYPLLPEIISGAIETESILNPIHQVVPEIDFYVGNVVHIDLRRKQVYVNHGLYGHRKHACVHTFDHLILALGGVPATDRIPGLTDYGFDSQRLTDAFALRNHLIDTLEQANIETDPDERHRLLTYTIIGGGPTGVEVAGEVSGLFSRAASHYPEIDPEDVRVVVIQGGDRLLPDMPDWLGSYAQRELTGRGVEIRYGERVARVRSDSVELTSGETIGTRTIVGATGIVPNPMITELPLPQDARGRVAVSSDLSVKDWPEVWALGDNATVYDPNSGSSYPQTAQHAVRQGKLVARNVVARINGKETTPMQYRTRGQMVPLGERKAVAEILGFTLSGTLAWLIWRTYYLFQLPRWAKRTRVAFDWTAGLFFPPDLVHLNVGQPPRSVPDTPEPGCELHVDDTHRVLEAISHMRPISGSGEEAMR